MCDVAGLTSDSEASYQSFLRVKFISEGVRASFYCMRAGPDSGLFYKQFPCTGGYHHGNHEKDG